MIHSCVDNEEKIILRTYDWYGKLVQFRLCNNHADNTKFSGYVSEIKIKSEAIQN